MASFVTIFQIFFLVSMSIANSTHTKDAGIKIEALKSSQLIDCVRVASFKPFANRLLPITELRRIAIIDTVFLYFFNLSLDFLQLSNNEFFGHLPF